LQNCCYTSGSFECGCYSVDSGVVEPHLAAVVSVDDVSAQTVSNLVDRYLKLGNMELFAVSVGNSMRVWKHKDSLKSKQQEVVAEEVQRWKQPMLGNCLALVLRLELELVLLEKGRNASYHLQLMRLVDIVEALHRALRTTL